ncbi:MAG: GNAT family N-acetyltransferase [Bacteroidota bacterium]
MSYQTVHLSGEYQKQLFSCGNEKLDTYLHKQAGQEVKKNYAAAFILPGNDPVKGLIIKGYYTLSGTGVPKDQAPEEIAGKIPYRIIPSILIGRLAVDQNFQRQGLGELLLSDALARIYDLSKTLGLFVVCVDPIDERAVIFYSKFGFILRPENGQMFLPMSVVQKMITGQR